MKIQKKPCQGYQEMKSPFWENEGEFISAFFLEFQTQKKAHYHLFSILPPSNSFHQKILLLSACLPFKKYFSRELLLTFPNVGWWQSVVYFPVHQILERCRKEKNEFEKKETLLYRRTNSVQSRKLLPAFDQSTTSEVATSCKLLFL